MTKNEEATQKTTSALLIIARKHFTQYGYGGVSLEKIAAEGHVTRGAVYHHFKNKQGLFLAVLNDVQNDVAAHTEQEAMKSDDPWQQLILGCIGFIKGANANESRRILLVDAPSAVGWNAWRKADQEHSMGVLQDHLEDLKAQGCLAGDVDTKLMTYSISGALNELALQYPSHETPAVDQALTVTVTQLVDGFKNRNRATELPGVE